MIRNKTKTSCYAETLLGNKRGSVMVIVLLILSLLTIIGVASTRTTVIEMQIANNQTVHKINFYRAEGVISEGMQIMEDADLENNPPDWILPYGSVLLTTGAAGTEEDDVYDDAVWTAADSEPSVAFPSAEVMSAYRGIAAGNSLSLGSPRIHVYDVYGRSQQNNGQSVIKMSFRKAY